MIPKFPRLLSQSVRKHVSVAGLSSSSTHDSSSCWHCGTEHNCCRIFCSNCGKIQPVGTSCCNYFKLLDMPVTFKVDEKSLENKYKEFQKVTHPDKFSMASEIEKEASSVSSSTINQAYQALRCPVDRAKYMLSLHGVNALEEDSSFEDPALMMEMFELRERIDNIDHSSPREAEGLLNELSDDMNQLCDEIEESFQAENLKASTRAAVKLKYISKAMDELRRVIEKASS